MQDTACNYTKEGPLRRVPQRVPFTSLVADYASLYRCISLSSGRETAGTTISAKTVSTTPFRANAVSIIVINVAPSVAVAPPNMLIAESTRTVLVSVANTPSNSRRCHFSPLGATKETTEPTVIPAGRQSHQNTGNNRYHGIQENDSVSCSVHKGIQQTGNTPYQS